MSPEDPRHGTYAGPPAHRADGEDPCWSCRVAHARYLDERERLIAYGRWNPWVPAEPARQHVRALMAAGMSTRNIAKTAGVPSCRVSHLLYGRGKKPLPTNIRPDYSEALLSIEPEPSRVPMLGAQRRLRALVALGYPSPHLGELLGLSQQRVDHYLRSPSETRIMRASHDRIVDLYERLSMTLPTTDTKREKYRVSRAKDTAKRNGWAPPLAWPDGLIDDPDHMPAGWQYRPTGRADNLRELVDHGAGISEACRRLHVTQDALEKWCSRHGMSAEFQTLVHRESPRGWWANQTGSGVA